MFMSKVVVVIRIIPIIRKKLTSIIDSKRSTIIINDNLCSLVFISISHKWIRV